MITEKDKVFKVDAESLTVQVLKSSGRQRHRFSVHYNMGDEYIYVIGGKDTYNDDNVSWAQRYHINKD